MKKEECARGFAAAALMKRGGCGFAFAGSSFAWRLVQYPMAGRELASSVE
jgi:hypothetical protein